MSYAIISQFIGGVVVILIGVYVLFMGGTAVFLTAGFSGRTSISGALAIVLACFVIYFGWQLLPINVTVAQ